MAAKRYNYNNSGIYSINNSTIDTESPSVLMLSALK